MKINMIKTVQIVYGIILILFGLNGFLSFLPIPEKEGFAFEFLHTLRQAGYIFPTVAAIMSATGIFLLLNRWVALVLLIQLPVSFNIFAFHLFHDWQGLIVAWAIWAFNLFLIMKHLPQYKILLNIKERSDVKIS